MRQVDRDNHCSCSSGRTLASAGLREQPQSILQILRRSPHIFEAQRAGGVFCKLLRLGHRVERRREVRCWRECGHWICIDTMRTVIKGQSIQERCRKNSRKITHQKAHSGTERRSSPLGNTLLSAPRSTVQNDDCSKRRHLQLGKAAAACAEASGALKAGGEAAAGTALTAAGRVAAARGKQRLGRTSCLQQGASTIPNFFGRLGQPTLPKEPMCMQSATRQQSKRRGGESSELWLREVAQNACVRTFVFQRFQKRARRGDCTLTVRRR